MASELALVGGYFTITLYFLFLSYLLKSKKLLFYGGLLFATASVAGLGFSLTILLNDNTTIQSLLIPFKDFLASLVAMGSFIYLFFLFWFVLYNMFKFVKDVGKKIK